MRRATTLTIFLLALAAPVWAADWYVNPATGSDAANLCTLTSPCQTVAKGLSKLSPGDTLYLRGGTYNTSLSGSANIFRESTTPSGTSWAAPIRISAFPVGGPATGIDYSRVYEPVLFTPSDTSTSNPDVIRFSGDQAKYIIFEGFTIDQKARASGVVLLMTGGITTNNGTQCDGSEDDAPGPLRFLNMEIRNCDRVCVGAHWFVHDLEFLNLHVHHCGLSGAGHCYYLVGNRLLWDGGSIHDSNKLGIQHFADAIANSVYIDLGCPLFGPATIRNMRVYNNRFSGILSGSMTTEAYIYNNVVYGNGGNGIMVGANGHKRVWNNTMWGNNPDLRIANDNKTYRNNIFNSLTVDAGLTGIVQDHNLHTGPTGIDPMFSSATNGDFRLVEGSPAIDAGATIGEVTHDFAGVVRPQPPGGAYDIGAYEFQSGVAIPFDFSIEVTALPPIQQSSSATSTVGVGRLTGAASSVSLSATGLPAGVTATFNPTSCTPPCTSVLSVQATHAAAPGTYAFSVTGTSGALTHTAAQTLQLFCPPSACGAPSDPTPQSVTDTMQRVAAFGRTQYSANQTPVWNLGVLHTGMMAHHRVTAEAAALAYTEAFGDFNNWTLSTTGVIPDRLVAGYAWLEVNAVAPEAVKIANTRTSVQSQSGSLSGYNFVDAIFMGLMTFVRMGQIDVNQSLRDSAFAKWQNIHTTLALYDTSEHLYYRDANFIGDLSPNGQKVLWSRGNGWAFAGLARILTDLPLDDPHRDAYIATFREMAASLLARQRTDGFWNSNLDDPDHFGGPETSGTALFVAGLAWGIRNGLLSGATYRPAALHGWQAIAGTAVQADGRVGYVQATGLAPAASTLTSSTDFGVGVVLLAGSEIYRLLGGVLP